MSESPEPIRRLWKPYGSFTILFFGLSTLLSSLLDMGDGDAIEFIVYAVLVGLVLDFWIHDIRVRNRISEIEQQRDEAKDALVDQDRLIAEIGEAEATNQRLEDEVDNLRLKLQTPKATLPDALHAIDRQLQAVGVVLKHRELEDQGLSKWPVTFIRLTAEDNVEIVAHIDDHSERLAGEPVSLVTGMGDIVTSGNVVGAGGNELSILAPLSQIPVNLETALRENGTLPSTGYSLQLLGLVASSPYTRMSSDDVRRLGDVLKETARVVAQALTDEKIQGPLELEAPENAD